MSQEIVETLKRFTPTMPDRDALLFAAGRAAAKPSPIWIVLCGILALSQVTTISILLTRSQPLPTTTPRTIITPPFELVEDKQSSPPDPYSYIALMRSGDYERTQQLPFPESPVRPNRALTAGMRQEFPQ